jgi:Glycosyltransferase family 87
MQSWKVLLCLVLTTPVVVFTIACANAHRVGWDYLVYRSAAQQLLATCDPYAHAITAQREFYRHPHRIDGPIPFPVVYVYPPMTLPLLAAFGKLSAPTSAAVFAVLTGIGIALMIWAGWQMATKTEREWLFWLIPFVPLFPGLTLSSAIYSENIAYFLYGLMMATAVPGWKRNRWSMFYFAVVLASTFKAPLLFMLAVPVVFGTRQLWRTIAAGFVGVALFAVQPLIWPSLFQEYLVAVRQQFDFNKDFGFSPSGVLSDYLVHAGMSYTAASLIFQLTFAAGVIAILRWVRNSACLSHPYCIPLGFVGVFLLNPRIMRYDVAALTIPLLLIVTRAFSELFQFWRTHFGTQPSRTIWRAAGIVGAGVFVGINIWHAIASTSGAWNGLDLAILLGSFGLGTLPLSLAPERFRLPSIELSR